MLFTPLPMIFIFGTALDVSGHIKFHENHEHTVFEMSNPVAVGCWSWMSHILEPTTEKCQTTPPPCTEQRAMYVRRKNIIILCVNITR
jgi:hypothetical protein